MERVRGVKGLDCMEDMGEIGLGEMQLREKLKLVKISHSLVEWKEED